jgi:hypothetical protein
VYAWGDNDRFCSAAIPGRPLIDPIELAMIFSPCYKLKFKTMLFAKKQIFILLTRLFWKFKIFFFRENLNLKREFLFGSVLFLSF